MTQTPATALRALLYARVSHGTDGASVDQQLAEGRKVAAREGWHIVGEHRDESISASRYGKGKARPGWQAAMDAVAAGTVDLLVVWEISRATRDRRVWAALLAACSDAGVRLAVGGRIHDPADPDDGFMLDLTAARSVHEAAITSKRVARDVAARAQSGRPHGRIAYGYTRRYDPATGRLAEQVPDPETGAVVAEIVARVLTGESCYAISADLNRRGVPSPQTVWLLRNRRPAVETPWTLDAVRRVAASPSNAGRRVYRGEVLPGVEAAWPPLVSLADHAAVTEMFADPARNTNHSNASTAAHLLVGIARCGVCGSTVRKVNNSGSVQYGCAARFCTGRSLRMVDEYVTEALLTRLERPDVADLFAVADDEEEAAREGARAELADARAALDGWYDAAAEGSVTPAGLAKIETRLLAKIADAEQRARPRPSSPVLAEVLDGDVRERWAALPIPARREVVRALMDVQIHRTRRGARKLDPESITITWR